MEKRWEQSESSFNEWIKGGSRLSETIETDILKTLFFYNREKIRQLVGRRIEKIMGTSPVKKLNLLPGEPEKELL